MGRDPLFWCGNFAIRRRPRPSRWGCLSPALTAAPCPWRFAARPAPASPLPGPQLRPCAPQLCSGLKLSLDLARRFGPAGDMRRAVHPRPGHGNISSRCVPKLSAVARYRPDAFTKGPRTGKAPLRGNISPACIQIQLVLARYARHASEKPRRAPLGNAPREHLAAKGRFRRPKPSDHARRTNLAILRWPCPCAGAPARATASQDRPSTA